MTIIIKIYILLCSALLLFDIGFLIVKNFRNLAAYRVNKNLKKQILLEIDLKKQTGEFSADFPGKLEAKLDRTANLLTLETVMEEKPETREWFRQQIFSRMKGYAGKDDYEQAYYTYILSLFDYQSEKMPGDTVDGLLDFLDSKSLYTFANTMNCLYAIAMTQPLMRAMEKIDSRQGFYHKKLLVDGLLTVRQEDGSFDEALKAAFTGYSPWLQDCLLDYFRLKGVDAAALCLQVLSGEQADTQVGYTAMRYFAKYPAPEARTGFLKILEDENASWIRQLLAIQALGCYADADVRAAVFTKVTSRNWHIRVNAVQYLSSRGLSREDVFDILYLRDRYTDEVLLYQYRGDKEMTRYIVDTIQLLKMQDSTVDASEELETLGIAETV